VPARCPRFGLAQGTATVDLTPAQLQRLDVLSKPPPTFPLSLGGIPASMMHGGMTVNGEVSAPLPFTPRADTPRF